MFGILGADRGGRWGVEPCLIPRLICLSGRPSSLMASLGHCECDVLDGRGLLDSEMSATGPSVHQVRRTRNSPRVSSAPNVPVGENICFINLNKLKNNCDSCR